MNDKTYNGWTNYETWNIKLWIDNDGSLEYWEERAKELLDRDPENAAYNLSKALEEEIMENAPDLGASMYADILTAALSSANWYEIAESIVDAVREEA